MPRPIKNKIKQEPDNNINYKNMNVDERRAYIAQVIQRYGIWGVNKSELSRLFGIRRDSIYNDFAIILPQINVIDGNEFTFEMARAFRNVEREHMNVLQDAKATKADKARSSQILLQCMEQSDKFLMNHNLLDVPKQESTKDVTFHDFVQAFKIAKEESNGKDESTQS